jgi:hypothetical protein
MKLFSEKENITEADYILRKSFSVEFLELQKNIYESHSKKKHAIESFIVPNSTVYTDMWSSYMSFSMITPSLAMAQQTIQLIS